MLNYENIHQSSENKSIISSLLTFTCSKSTRETLEKDVKY